MKRKFSMAVPTRESGTCFVRRKRIPSVTGHYISGEGRDVVYKETFRAAEIINLILTVLAATDQKDNERGQ